MGEMLFFMWTEQNEWLHHTIRFSLLIPPQPSECLEPIMWGFTTRNCISFWGTIDELSIYARALAPSEVETIYDAGGYGKCPDLAPV